MELYILNEDINVCTLKASSFPAGIMKAHQDLHVLVKNKEGRRYFGISYPENGTIGYWAGIEEMHPGEAEELGCERFIIRKGEYTSEVITDYMKDLTRIGSVFKQILTDHRIDPGGACIEMYPSPEDVRCMVRLTDGHAN